MSKPVLYGVDLSPPVRACHLTFKALGLDYVYKNVDLIGGEHLTEEFLKHNPQHTVPVLNDGDAWIWDSHAICTYLVSKYGKDDDTLYPKDLVKRAHVDQRLYFEASVLFMALRNISVAFFRKNVTVVMKDKTEPILEGYDFVEKFLGDNQYICGDTLTIADFCTVATLSSLRGIVEINMHQFPKTFAYLDRLAKLPYYQEANGKGAEEYCNLLKNGLTEIIL